MKVRLDTHGSVSDPQNSPSQHKSVFWAALAGAVLLLRSVSHTLFCAWLPDRTSHSRRQVYPNDDVC
jgi:hypothetical protein